MAELGSLRLLGQKGPAHCLILSIKFYWNTARPVYVLLSGLLLHYNSRVERLQQRTRGLKILKSFSDSAQSHPPRFKLEELPPSYRSERGPSWVDSAWGGPPPRRPCDPILVQL